MISSYRIGVVILIAIASVAANAQDEGPADSSVEASFRASRTTPLVGEPVQLTLTVAMPAGYEIAEWPELPETWQDFDVAAASDVESQTQSNGIKTISQNWTVRLWRPDDFETPETFVGYRTPNSDEILRLPVSSVFFTVESILDPGDLNLRPARQPIRFVYVPVWATVMIIVAAGAMAYTGRNWYKRYQQHQIDNPNVELSPAQIADHHLTTAIEMPTRYEQLGAISDALRQFVDRQFQVETLSQTTEEIGHDKRLRDRLTAQQWRALMTILSTVDLLRFAPQPSDDQTLERYIRDARQWVATVALTSTERAA